MGGVTRFAARTGESAAVTPCSLSRRTIPFGRLNFHDDGRLSAIGAEAQAVPPTHRTRTRSRRNTSRGVDDRSASEAREIEFCDAHASQEARHRVHVVRKAKLDNAVGDLTSLLLALL